MKDEVAGQELALVTLDTPPPEYPEAPKLRKRIPILEYIVFAIAGLFTVVIAVVIAVGIVSVVISVIVLLIHLQLNIMCIVGIPCVPSEKIGHMCHSNVTGDLFGITTAESYGDCAPIGVPTTCYYNYITLDDSQVVYQTSFTCKPVWELLIVEGVLITVFGLAFSFFVCYGITLCAIDSIKARQ